MAPSRTGSYKQIFKPEKPENLRTRLGAANRQPLGNTAAAEKEVNSGMKTRLTGSTRKTKVVAVPKDAGSDDSDNSNPPLLNSHRSKDGRFRLADSDSDEDDGLKEEEEEEEEEVEGRKNGRRKANKKGKAKAIQPKTLHVQVLALIPIGKEKIQAAGGRLALSKKDVEKFKAAGLWIDDRELAFKSNWVESKMLEWARSFFDDKIEELRDVEGASDHINTVSPLMIKGNTVELVPRTVKWSGPYVAERARHSGKSATVAAGRLALVTCVEVPDPILARWTLERTRQRRREVSEDRYSNGGGNDGQLKRGLSLSDDDDDKDVNAYPVKRSRDGSPGNYHDNPVEVDEESNSDNNQNIVTPTQFVGPSGSRPRPRYLRPRPSALPVSPLPPPRHTASSSAAGPSSHQSGPSVSSTSRVNQYQGMADTAKVPDPFASSDA